MKMPSLGNPSPLIKNRPLDMLATDTAAVRAIAQAATQVELFTIPLYMTTMYSIFGTHQINAKGISYYKGRQWPGMSTTAGATDPGQQAFNSIFSVFIQEMLHLQMAANLSTAIGATPCFTGAPLQNLDNGWTCYGPDLTVIPHIVDLRDTAHYQHVRVNLEELNANQCELFIAIEQPEMQAREELLRFHQADDSKYFPAVPLAGWTPLKTAADLPLFGTIGYLYECYAQYIGIEYTDGATLWDKLFDAASVQQDMFNSKVPGHAQAEFPQLATLFQYAPGERPETLFNTAIDMMAAITDQGEGNAGSIRRYRRSAGLQAVLPDYREDDAALGADYPSYTGAGELTDSADAAARGAWSAQDHYERFLAVRKMLPEVHTWKQWHAAGNRWSGEMLVNSDYDPGVGDGQIPLPQDVADALNRLKQGDQTFIADALNRLKQGDQTFTMLSKVASGSLYGITSVLDTYWQVQGTTFPYPSMVGAGDRVSLCWAVLGCAPDLRYGVTPPQSGVLQHACQGLSLDPHAAGDASCAALEVYHTCRGSNGCHAQGGCGFVQPVGGGGSCGHSVKVAPAGLAPQASALVGAPSDNKCKAFGGCAVPISASQLFPSSGAMQLFNFGPAPDHDAIALPGKLDFEEGDNVFDTAWAAYLQVIAARGGAAPAKPAPSDLRLALPPST